MQQLFCVVSISAPEEIVKATAGSDAVSKINIELNDGLNTCLAESIGKQQQEISKFQGQTPFWAMVDYNLSLRDVPAKDDKPARRFNQIYVNKVAKLW